MNDPQPDIFDPGNARDLCRASAESYQSRLPVAQISLWGRATDTRVLLTPGANDLVVAFRGTQDLRNWLTDLDCEFLRLGRVRVHRGFYRALASVWEDLNRAIENLAPARLWLTGHSLGGALAMIYAWQSARRVDGLYTFGQPRVGDADFVRAYGSSGLNARTFRVIHADDIVPRVPWLLGRYRHAGHETFYPDLLSSRSVLDCPFWRKLVYDIPGLIREATRDKLALLHDHHVKSYLSLFPEAGAARSLCLS